VTAGSGLLYTGFFLQGLFRDLDNDTHLDIVTGSTHFYFKGHGNGTFTKVDDVFPASKEMHSFAFGDFNKDGFEDVYATYGDGYVDGDAGFPDKLWMNTPNGNHFLNVNLEGTVSNRDAVGGRVTITGPWGTMIREVHAGESYGITNTFTCHFGLGPHTVIPTMVVRFPSGQEQTYTNVNADQNITVVEGGCVSPNVSITSDGGDLIWCEGDAAITLFAPTLSGYSAVWNDGSMGASVTANGGGTWSVTLSNGDQCPATAIATIVENPDQTPSIAVNGPLSFCETDGPITLTSSALTGNVWSTEAETQTIEVNSSGTYSVTVNGACQPWTSTPVEVVVEDAPEAPVANGATAIAGTSADLNATGDNVVWYDVPTDGVPVGTGNAWTTPVLFATTSFWCADQNQTGGEIFYGGRTDQTASGEISNSGFHLLFEANEDMIIKSVKVYAGSDGPRTVEVYDMNANATVAEGTFQIPEGESRVDLNFSVPAGGPYGLRFSSEDPGCWRDGLGSDPTYPYDLGGLGAITGTTVQGGNTNEYYYFFYDWEVERPLTACESERTEVVVEVSVGLEDGGVQGFSIFPVPTSSILNIDFGTIIGEVDMDLVDVTGRIVRSEHRTVKGIGTIDVSALARGEYTLRVRHANGQLVSRVVVR
jgi:ASPIC and UnbV/Secretion system C-terminal sorting domain/FG-GAP-like repeat/Ig-like domain CHU_C associated